MNINFFRPGVLIFTSALLSACGGGGGGQTTPTPVDPIPTTPVVTNQAPLAQAGVDLVVNEKSEVALSGSGSDTDGSIASYQWIQTSGANVVLSDNSIANPQFTAPDLTTGSQSLSFELTVTDNEGLTAKDSLTVTVNDVNVAPVALAGDDLVVNEKSDVALSGSGSDVDGSIASYQWIQTSGTTVVLSDSAINNPHFTAPDLTTGSQSLSFELSVTDNNGLTAKDSLFVTVNDVNAAPIAVAGADLVVNEKSEVVLAGSGSDVDGFIASYQWAQISGTPVTLNDTTTATPHFVAPELSTGLVSLSFELTVTDNNGLTAKDSLLVTVVDVNVAPLAVAGDDLVVDENSVVTLSGSGSDADGSIASYRWAQTSGTVVTLSDSAIANPQFTTPNLTTGSQALTFELTVTDNNGSTAKDSMLVTVNNVNGAPTASAGVDLVVNEKSEVTLSGSGSDLDGSITSYQWVQTSGTSVVLSDSAIANPIFTAPDLASDAQSLGFELTVTDNDGLSAKDSVIVTVNNVNIVPIAQAGEPLVVDEKAIVTLQGEGTDEDGSIVAYEWTQTEGETVSLSDVTSATPSFNAPVVALGSLSLKFKLTVTDNDGNTANDSVEVMVNSTNSAPVINAGADKFATGSSLVQLDGSGSDSDGTSVVYLWTQVDGTAVTLSDASIVNPTFTAPVSVNGGVAMTFKLQGTDERGVVVEDTVVITVTDIPLNLFSGATVQAGEKVLWSFPIDYWTNNFIVESEGPVDLNVEHWATFSHERWFSAPMVAQPLQVNLRFTGYELLDTVTIMPIEQFGFKSLTSIENFYQNSGFGASSGSLFTLIDNDSLPDLVLYSADSISWFKGKGDGTFGTQTPLYTGKNIQSVTFEDVNNDAQKDLVVKMWGGEDNAQVVWLEKQLTTSVEFSAAKTIASNSLIKTFTESAIVDIDGDGRVDFVNFYELDNVLTLSYYKQEADGSFSTEVLIDKRTQEIKSAKLSIGDVNGDKLLDLQLYIEGSNDIAWFGAELSYFNQGNGDFEIPDAELSRDYMYYVVTAVDIDINNDGVIDTFVEETQELMLGLRQCLHGYISQPDGTREYKKDLLCESNSLPEYHFIDLDGDGDDEIVINNASYNCLTCVNARYTKAAYLGFLENTGNGFITEPKVIAYDKEPSSFSFKGVDFNGDGKASILKWDGLASCTDCEIQWYEQQSSEQP